MHAFVMTRVARRWGLAVSLALIPSLMTVPSHASEPTAEPSPTATVETAPVEATPTTEPTPEPTAAPTTAAPAPVQRQVAKVAATPTRKAASSPTRKYWVSLRLNSGNEPRVFTRENFWLRGRVFTTKGKPQANVAVRIYRDTKKGRTTVATVRTAKDGSYIWSPTNRRAGTYRAVATKVRYSPKVTVKVQTGRRTLASREKSLSFLLGGKKGALKRSGKVTWQEYGKAILIQYGTRTWVVRGAAVGRVRAHGGPAGSLGAPTGDVRCGLPERGCLQQFRTGAVYVNSKAKHKVTSAVAPKLGAADLVAVAKSQVGYRESAPRKSKYNKWIGRTGPYDPWCGFFTSWLAYAAGKPGSVIKAKSYPALLKAERKRGRTTNTARVGRLAYIGYFRKGSPTHVGIVQKVSGSHVWVIEGNVSAGGGTKHPRGVHLVKRPKSDVVFYADPRY